MLARHFHGRIPSVPYLSSELEITCQEVVERLSGRLDDRESPQTRCEGLKRVDPVEIAIIGPRVDLESLNFRPIRRMQNNPVGGIIRQESLEDRPPSPRDRPVSGLRTAS